MHNKINLSSMTAKQLCWFFLKSYKKLIGGSLIFLLIAAFTILGAGRGLQYLIDHAFTDDQSRVLEHDMIFYYSITGVVVLAISAFGRTMLTGRLGEKLVADIKQHFFKHLLRFDRTLYEQQTLGDLMSRLHQDTYHILTFISNSGAVTIRSLIQLIGGTVLILSTSLKLTGLVFLIIPVIVLPITLLGRKVRQHSHSAQTALGKIEAYSAEALKALTDIQLFQMEATVAQHFQELTQQRWLILRKRLLTRSLLVTIVIACAFSAISGVIWIGTQDVINGNLTAGALASFIFYALVVGGSLNQIAELLGDFQAARGACDRLAETFKLQPQIVSVQENSSVHSGLNPQTIAFKDVSFAYPIAVEKQVLHNISFKLQRGQKIALVGSSGSGKTTIFRLLTRLYDPRQGTITIDGQALTSMDVADVRALFSSVSQDPILFNASVYDNIAFGCISASHQTVMDAARFAAVDEFTQQLPNKFETIIGEQGFRLSGGQKQRIALARAFLRQAPILLMDEATNSLDAFNEAHIQHSIDNLLHKRTALIIAHRLSTVLKADHILVFDQGQIVQRGTHESLMNEQGLYRNLAELQYFHENVHDIS